MFLTMVKLGGLRESTQIMRGRWPAHDRKHEHQGDAREQGRSQQCHNTKRHAAVGQLSNMECAE